MIDDIIIHIAIIIPTKPSTNFILYNDKIIEIKFNDVSIASFDPEISGDFLGDGGSLTLVCPSSGTGNETIQCEGTVEVNNNGGTAIEVSTSDSSVSLDFITQDEVTATAGDPTFSWTNTTIAAGSTETLTVTVPVDLDSDFGTYWDSDYRSSAYNGEALEVTVSFKIVAAQVHD